MEQLNPSQNNIHIDSTSISISNTSTSIVLQDKSNRGNPNTAAIANSSSFIGRTISYFKNKTKNLTQRQVGILSLLAFVDLLASQIISIQSPFFPEVATNKGATAAEYGLVFGIFEFTAIIFSPIFGAKMKVLGPIRVFIGGILTTGICSVIFGFLDRIQDSTTFIGWCTFIRIIEAIGDSAYATASYTIVTMEFPNSVATTFSIFETCYGLGMITGPLIGGILYDVGGYTLPFLSMGTILFISAIISVIFLPNRNQSNNYYKNKSHPSESEEELKSSSSSSSKVSNNSHGLFNFIRLPVIWMTSFGIVTAAIGAGFLSGLIEPHLRKFQLSKTMLGGVIIFTGGTYAITAPLWGWLCDSKRINPKILTLMGSLLSIVGFALIGPLPFVPFETILWITCIGLALFGLGMGAIFVSAFIIYLHDAIERGYPDDVSTYGLISGLWTAMVSLGYGIGPTIGGLFEDYVGFRWGSLFVIGTNFILSIWICIYLIVTNSKRKTNSKPKEEEEESYNGALNN